MNAATLNVGSIGRVGQLVQMVLLDLGYAMPGPTGNPNYSFDKIYGKKTRRSKGMGWQSSCCSHE
jgi:hypothetical protein